MKSSPTIAEETVAAASDLLMSSRGPLLTTLQELDAPIYVTDGDGVIVYFNDACIGFAGRTPVTGKDRWCVSWKLYTEAGAFLAHEDCPMALAVRSQKPVRGVTALAERPDGTRVTFMPLPTPVYSRDGAFIGAVNILLDMTDLRQIDELRSQAERCFRLARAIGDARTAATLQEMAGDYLTTAAALERAKGLTPSAHAASAHRARLTSPEHRAAQGNDAR